METGHAPAAVNALEVQRRRNAAVTEWVRTKSGCYFCFYQQKIEWVRLKGKLSRSVRTGQGIRTPPRRERKHIHLDVWRGPRRAGPPRAHSRRARAASQARDRAGSGSHVGAGVRRPDGFRRHSREACAICTTYGLGPRLRLTGWLPSRDVARSTVGDGASECRGRTVGRSLQVPKVLGIPFTSY